MMQDRLAEMMTETAQGVAVAPAPLEQMVRAGRRRRAGARALAAAAVLAVVGAGAGAHALLGEPSAAPAPATPGPGWEEGVPVLLDDSPFEVGVDAPRGDDALRGELRATADQRCLVVGAGENPVHWPHEWSGRVFDDGRFVLYDEDGAAVAEVGDRVVLGGTLSSPASWSGDQVCDAGVVRVFMVESVRVE